VHLAGREQVVGEEASPGVAAGEDPRKLGLTEDAGRVTSPGRLLRATASKNDSALRQLGLSPLVSVGGRDSSSDPLGHESSSRVRP